ncbi:MAG: FAD-dependent oxidoreductase [Pseudomonadota bacterium]
MQNYDAVVIGGGPAGLTAALYLVRAGVSVALVEKLSVGGQVLMTEAIENYPGFPKGIKGWEMADALEAHLQEYTLDRFNDEVTAIEVQEGAHRVCVGGTWITCRSLVLCSGARYKKLGLPNEERLTGRGISYCALCDGNFFRGQNVGVVGGGNSALEESLYLSKLVNKLHIIHRREDFRATRIYQEKVEATPSIEILRHRVVEELHGDDAFTGVTLKDPRTGETSFLPLDGLFVFIGFEPVGAFLPQELALDDHGFIITDGEMHTNIPGIFAAGDIRSKLCRQVATAVGDGATAANAATIYLEQLNA